MGTGMHNWTHQARGAYSRGSLLCAVKPHCHHSSAWSGSRQWAYGACCCTPMPWARIVVEPAALCCAMLCYAMIQTPTRQQQHQTIEAWSLLDKHVSFCAWYAGFWNSKVSIRVPTTSSRLRSSCRSGSDSTGCTLCFCNSNNVTITDQQQTSHRCHSGQGKSVSMS